MVHSSRQLIPNGVVSTDRFSRLSVTVDTSNRLVGTRLNLVSRFTRVRVTQLCPLEAVPCVIVVNAAFGNECSLAIRKTRHRSWGKRRQGLKGRRNEKLC